MIPSSIPVYVCTQPMDMRCSFDGLAIAVRQRLGHDPQKGGLFVFTNCRQSRLKMLWFDCNGYCIFYKRLHRAIFRLQDSSNETGPAIKINGHALRQLIQGFERPKKSKKVA